jgi:hypothetical protein
MQSPRGFAGSIVLIAGVVLALASGIIFNAGASEIIHVAMGLSFLLLASAVFDFRVPRAVNLIAAVSMVALALIFLAQAVADLSGSTAIAGIAYGVLGQLLERALGYVFLGWCIVVVLGHSTGWQRIVGFVVLLIVMASEIYTSAVSMTGGEAPVTLKFLLLLLFVWLALESSKPRAAA